MNYETLLIDKSEGIGTITFNRPDKLNAFNPQCFQELIEALHELDGDEAIRVIVLTGAGRAFSAGLDLDQARQGPSEFDKQTVPLQDTLAWTPHVIRSLKKPIIASLNGATAGAGFSIAVACDMRIASDALKMGAPFLSVGLVPELGSTYNLPRLVGIAKAFELVYTARVVDALEAKEMGLVNQVVPAEELAAATRKLASKIASMPPIALQLARKAMYQGLDADLTVQIQFEQLSQSTCFKTRDHIEGIQAFLEKRKPSFTGK